MMWLWRSRTGAARAARAACLPAAGLFGLAASLRGKAYRSGRRRARTFPRFSVVVGALQAGGAGKTPLASWIARWYGERGLRPGILLRGYGGDEGGVHRASVPEGVVVEGADRHRAARAAVERGADVLVLDDGFQRVDFRPDISLVLVSAELANAPPWPLPAGPWREAWGAIDRADAVIVTVKSAGAGAVAHIAERARARGSRVVAVARLEPRVLAGLRSGRIAPIRSLHGRRVLVSAGIADPGALASQLTRSGARVRLMRRRDHHRYRRSDVERMVRAGQKVDYVVVTKKDAVKLRARWPAHAPEPLVAELDVSWIEGWNPVERLLSRALPQRKAMVATHRRRTPERVA